MKLLQTADLTGLQHDARNTFMLQFYAYGSRISDALLWKKADVQKDGEVWYLSYTSMKTGSPDKKISAALGHSKFSNTEVYPSELRQSDINDAMEAVR